MKTPHGDRAGQMSSLSSRAMALSMSQEGGVPEALLMLCTLQLLPCTVCCCVHMQCRAHASCLCPA